MATVDNLDIQISASAKKANESLDKLISKLKNLSNALKIDTSSLSNIGKNFGLESTTKELKNVQAEIKNFAKSAETPIKRISKTLEQITGQYKDLGKGFSFKGTTQATQKEIDKLSNALEKAKLRKEELELAGKTEGQGYEDAVKNVIKYTNQIESLKKQLEGLKAPENLTASTGLSKEFEEKFQREFGDKKLEVPVNLKVSEEYKQKIQDSIPSVSAKLDVDTTKFKTNFDGIEEYIDNYVNKVNDASVSMSELANKLEQIVVPEIREDNLEKLRSELRKTEEQTEKLHVKLENEVTMGRIAENPDDKGFVKIQEQIAYTEKQAEALREKIAEVESETKKEKGFAGLKDTLTSFSSVSDKASFSLSNISANIKKFTSGIKEAVAKVSSLTKSLLGIKDSSKKSEFSLSKTFKMILRYGLGIRSVYALINKIRRAIVDGFKNLSQYSDEVNGSISMLKSSLGALKNSFAAAFAPILNVVAPYVSAFIDMITDALNAVARFFAALTGKKVVAQAKKNMTDYATGVSGAGSAAKQAAKDIKSSLGAFHELNVLTTSDTSGAGGGGGAGGGTDISASDMFETVEVESDISNFAKKIKEAWKNADFTELGTIFGTKLKDALDSIPWDPIKTSAQKVGKSLATFINGAVETAGLANSIGKTLGETINTAVDGINSYLDNTHWNSIGTFIGDGLNGLVNTINWQNLGHLFAAKWNGVFEMMGSAVSTFDWSKFGSSLETSLKTFLQEIKWDTVYQGAKNFGSGLAQFLNGLITPELFKEIGSTIAKTLNSAIYSALSLGEDFDAKNAGDSIASAVNGFFKDFDFDALADTANTWVDNIKTTILDAIKKIKWTDVIKGAFNFASGLELDTIAITVGAFTWWHGGKEILYGNLRDLLKTKISTGLGAGTISLDKAIAISLLTAKIGFEIGEWLYNNTPFKKFSDAVVEWMVDKNGDVSIPKAITLTLGALAVSIGVATLTTAVASAVATAAAGGIAVTGIKLALTTAALNIATGASFVWNGLTTMASSLATALSGAIGGLASFGKTIASGIGTAFSAAKSLLSTAGTWAASVAPLAAGLFAAVGAAIGGWKLGNLIAEKLNLGQLGEDIYDYLHMTDNPADLQEVTNWAREVKSIIKEELENKETAKIQLQANLEVKANKLDTTEIDGKTQVKTTAYMDKTVVAAAITGKDIPSTAYMNKLQVDNHIVGGKINQRAYLYKSEVAPEVKSKKIPSTAYFNKREVADAIKNKAIPTTTKFTSVDKTQITGTTINTKSKFTSVDKTQITGTAIDVKAIINQVGSALSGIKVTVGGKADGGIFSGGVWKNIPQYAAGGLPNYGTLFMAGEAGPEVVGHVGGRTEVLNQSQLARAMYESTVNANAESNALLREQNSILMQILQKETGISSRDIFNAVRSEGSDYRKRTGKSPF